MSSTKKTYKVGDEVKVGKDEEYVVGPDGSAATVRSGGSYRFTAAGRYVIGKRTFDVTK